MSGSSLARRPSTEGARAAAPAPGPRVAGAPARGQTTLDFAVGMSVFLLALAFVFVFVPGMLAPFEAGTQSETTAVNRVADDLTQRTLTNASQPYALGTRCTRSFFEDGAPPSACHFEDGTTAERVGVKARMPVNVTVRSDLGDSDDDPNTLCWDAASSQFVEQDSADCDPALNDVLLTRGPRPGGSGGKTVSAQRVALLEGEDVTVEVVMW